MQEVGGRGQRWEVGLGKGEGNLKARQVKEATPGPAFGTSGLALPSYL